MVFEKQIKKKQSEGGKDNAHRQRSKIPLTSPSGGWSTNPPFSGPYLLNT